MTVSMRSENGKMTTISARNIPTQIVIHLRALSTSAMIVVSLFSRVVCLSRVLKIKTLLAASYSKVVLCAK